MQQGPRTDWEHCWTFMQFVAKRTIGRGWVLPDPVNTKVTAYWPDASAGPPLHPRERVMAVPGLTKGRSTAPTEDWNAELTPGMMSQAARAPAGTRIRITSATLKSRARLRTRCKYRAFPGSRAREIFDGAGSQVDWGLRCVRLGGSCRRTHPSQNLARSQAVSHLGDAPRSSSDEWKNASKRRFNVLRHQMPQTLGSTKIGENPKRCWGKYPQIDRKLVNELPALHVPLGSLSTKCNRPFSSDCILSSQDHVIS